MFAYIMTVYLTNWGKKMKQTDLYREWARVLDMCEGNRVSPTDCWRIGGVKKFFYPEFTADPDTYQFAVAILEDKPVFFGDKIYSKFLGEEFDWDDRDHIRQITCENLPIKPDDVWSWTPPPKKTFMLNGVELPGAERGMEERKSRLILSCQYGDVENKYAFFDFDGEKDSKKVFDVLVKILSENT